MKRDTIIYGIFAVVIIAVGYKLWRHRSLMSTKEGAIHTYDYPVENNGWKKYGHTPVYGDSVTGTIFDPFVTVQHDSLVMVASERKTGNIIRLTSIDGIKWAKTNTMLSCQPNTWEHIVNRACILGTDSIWHMWYTGQSPDTSWIGHATSKDGYVFQRDSFAVIKPTLKSEGISVMNPCVIYNKQKKCLQMWYAAGDNYEPDVLFYAESKDGIHWIKHNKPVMEKYSGHKWEQAKVGGCYVLLDSNKNAIYEMYYIGYQDVNTARICYATSTDGITWNRPADNLIITPSKGAWDSEATYKPTFIEWRGKDMLWYNGRTANKEYIGLAIKN